MAWPTLISFWQKEAQTQLCIKGTISNACAVLYFKPNTGKHDHNYVLLVGFPLTSGWPFIPHGSSCVLMLMTMVLFGLETKVDMELYAGEPPGFHTREWHVLPLI